MIKSIANEDQAEEFAKQVGLHDMMFEEALSARLQRPGQSVCIYQKLSKKGRKSIALVAYFDGYAKQEENGWWAIRIDGIKNKKEFTKAGAMIDALVELYQEKMRDFNK